MTTEEVSTPDDKEFDPMRRAGLFTLIVMAVMLPSCGSGSTDTPTNPGTPTVPSQPASMTATVTVTNANAGTTGGHNDPPSFTDQVDITDIFIFSSPPAVGAQLGTVRHFLTRGNGGVFSRDSTLDPDFFEAGTTFNFATTLVYERSVADGDGGKVVSVRVEVPMSDELGNASTVVSPETDVPDNFLRNVRQGSCTSDDTTACLLNDGRFQVEVDWFDNLNSGPGTVVNTNPAIGGVDFRLDGADPFFDLFVQLQNLCGDNDTFLVFAAGPTNVGFTLTVTDTASGQFKTYENSLGTPFQPIQDTEAFATCPGPVPVP